MLPTSSSLTCTSLTNPASGQKIHYKYDSLDRTTNITKQNSKSILILFNKTLVKQLDENKNRIDYIIDAYGRITKIREYNLNYTGSQQVHNTTYKYRADDLLMNITDSKGNLFLFSYDSLGRKTSFNDPNMARWRYAYDLAGNLINQTDGRNRTIALTYDSLNRVTRKQAANITNTFTYDYQYNGTLYNITINQTGTTQIMPIYYKYWYDTRLRVVQEGVYYPLSTVYKRWINYTVSYDSADHILKMYLPLTNLSHRYNLLGKLDTVQGFLNSISYNSFGSQQNKTYANNIVTKYSIDNMGRLSGIRSTVQALNYSYDSASNIQRINDSYNAKLYTMKYDNLSRLTRTKIADYRSMEHEKLVYKYDSIGNILKTISDKYNTTLGYGSLAHTPATVTKTARPAPTIQFTRLIPNTTINVNQYRFFNFTATVCCRQNDCWGINVTLDPDKEEYTIDSKTQCTGGTCNLVLHSGTMFVLENNTWKPIEEASSLKGKLTVNIEKDENYPATVKDYNLTSITLELGIGSNWKLLQSIPLKVYDKTNASRPITDREGKTKDQIFRFVSKNDKKTITMDISDTNENILSAAFRWGEESTLITVTDTTSKNLADTYVRSGSTYNNTNFGTVNPIYVQNITSPSYRYLLLKFNLSQIPREAVVERARLHLYIYSNSVPAGTHANISTHRIFHSYSWNETGVTWGTRPVGAQYNHTPSDKVTIAYGTVAVYKSWNVTTIVKQKKLNESFYFYQNNMLSTSTGSIGFNAKEAFGNRPYLNITYTIKGKVSTTKGETPFYTTTQNPYTIDLEQDQCRNITWRVNASGTKRDYLFYANATKISNTSVKAKSGIVQINII